MSLKEFKNIWPIWHAGMKTPKNGLSCQIRKHLAWPAPWAQNANFLCFLLSHATCQTCQMFKRKNVKVPGKATILGQFRVYLACDGGGYTGIQPGSQAVYPPPRGEIMNTFQAARRYLTAGLAVIPIWPDKRKNPHLSSFSEFTRRLPTVEEWVRWANRWPAANLGLITGYWQNYVCLDFDDTAGFDVWASGPGYGVIGQTWQVQTGRGYHVWFKVSDDPGASRKYTSGPHEVLLRARGGYCIVPPSIHHSGRPYKTVHKVKPMIIDTINHYLEGWQEQRAAQPARPHVSRSIPAGRVRLEELIAIPERSRANARGTYQVYCPFHEDGRPSAWLNVDQQRFGCNACWPGLWWDVVNVYAMLKGLDNNQVYKEWGQDLGSNYAQRVLSPQQEKGL